jgi:hypothetical protein
MTLVLGVRTIGPSIEHINQAGAFESQERKVVAVQTEFALKDCTDSTGFTDEAGQHTDLARELHTSPSLEASREWWAQLDTAVMILGVAPACSRSKGKPWSRNVYEIQGSRWSKGLQQPAQQCDLFPVPFGIAGKGKWHHPRGSKFRETTHVRSSVDNHHGDTQGVAGVGGQTGLVQAKGPRGGSLGETGPLADENPGNHNGERGGPRRLGPKEQQ